jgi:glutamyl-tRNA synthetase
VSYIIRTLIETDERLTGIRSRGMTVKGLKDYILMQGASQQTMQLEWDGIWTVNKRVIDPIAPRYWAIAEDRM